MKIKSLLICLFFLGSISMSNAQEKASVVLEKAYKQAKKENKKVLVIFHASWCTWCKKIEKNMEADAVRALFHDNYVITYLTVQESTKNKHLNNPGADEVLKKYKGDKQGIPFWVILDAKGNLLEDSFNAKGENLGCPAALDEVMEFNAKLKRTSKLNDKDLAAIAQVFTIKE